MGRTDESCEDEDEDVKPLPFTVTQLRVNVNAPPFFFNLCEKIVSSSSQKNWDLNSSAPCFPQLHCVAQNSVFDSFETVAPLWTDSSFKDPGVLENKMVYVDVVW